MLLFEPVVNHPPETAAMNGAAAEALNGFQVRFCGIPLVTGKVEFRIIKVVTGHEVVPRDLGHNGGSGNGYAF